MFENEFYMNISCIGDDFEQPLSEKSEEMNKEFNYDIKNKIVICIKVMCETTIEDDIEGKCLTHYFPKAYWVKKQTYSPSTNDFKEELIELSDEFIEGELHQWHYDDMTEKANEAANELDHEDFGSQYSDRVYHGSR